MLRGRGITTAVDCMGLDQGCLGPSTHCYSPVLAQWLPPGLQVRALLQIGACWGQSLAAWADYFPDAQVVGIDLWPERFWHFGAEALRQRGMNHSRVSVLPGNASDPKLAGELQQQFGPYRFDAILDDGSHEYADILVAFRELFVRLLKPGGVYIIEDTKWAWKNQRLHFFLKDLIENAVYLRDQDFDSAQLHTFLTLTGEPDPLTIWVEAVEFRRSTIVIRKRPGYL